MFTLAEQRLRNKNNGLYFRKANPLFVTQRRKSYAREQILIYSACPPVFRQNCVTGT